MRGLCHEEKGENGLRAAADVAGNEWRKRAPGLHGKLPEENASNPTWDWLGSHSKPNFLVWQQEWKKETGLCFCYTISACCPLHKASLHPKENKTLGNKFLHFISWVQRGLLSALLYLRLQKGTVSALSKRPTAIHLSQKYIKSIEQMNIVWTTQFYQY